MPGIAGRPSTRDLAEIDCLLFQMALTSLFLMDDDSALVGLRQLLQIYPQSMLQDAVMF